MRLAKALGAGMVLAASLLAVGCGGMMGGGGNVAPYGSVSSPSEGQVITSPLVNIEGMANDSNGNLDSVRVAVLARPSGVEVWNGTVSLAGGGISPWSTSADLSGRANGLYTVRVFVMDLAGTAGTNVEVGFTLSISTGLAAPTGLTVSGETYTSLDLSWNASTGASGYRLYRDLDAGGGSTIPVYDGSDTFFSDQGLDLGTTYWYRVTAVGAGGEGSPSVAVSGTTLGLDAYESDNTPATGWYIFFGDPVEQARTLYPVGDRDWIKLSAEAGRTYAIETLSGGVVIDTYLEVYATDATTVLASDDDSGTDLFSRIVWTAPSAGDFYIRVREFTDSQAGPYVISIMYDDGTVDVTVR